MPNTRLVYLGVEAIRAIVEEMNGPTESDIPFDDLLELSNTLKFILLRGIKRTKCEWPPEAFMRWKIFRIILMPTSSTSRYSNSPRSIKISMLPHSIELSTFNSYATKRRNGSVIQHS